MSFHIIRKNTSSSNHKRRHQDCILKEIQQKSVMQKQTSQGFFVNHNDHNNPLKWLQKSASTTFHEPSSSIQTQKITSELNEINKIKKKAIRSTHFSLRKNEQVINKRGWEDFEQRYSVTQHQLKRVRKKAKDMLPKQPRAEIKSIYTNQAIQRIQDSQNCQKYQQQIILRQPIQPIINFLSAAPSNEHSMYLTVAQVKKKMSQSMILRNAYNCCVKSQKFANQMSSKYDKQQSLRSFIYFNEFKHKIPKKGVNALMKNNYLLF